MKYTRWEKISNDINPHLNTISKKDINYVTILI